MYYSSRKLTLPDNFAGELSTIYVYISDEHAERQYFFYLRGAMIEDKEPEKINKPKL